MVVCVRCGALRDRPEDKIIVVEECPACPNHTEEWYELVAKTPPPPPNPRQWGDGYQL